MTRLQLAWVAALALTIIAGCVIALIGPTPTTAIGYAFTVLAVVIVPWGLMVLQAVRQPPTVDPSNNGQRPPTEELELEESTS